jgi:hypothetical protein
MTRRLIFTVDVDRDVNFHVAGQIAAASIDRGQGTEPRFSSSEKGLTMIAGLLDDLGIKGTFFIEGRTSELVDCSIISDHCIGFHGYDHEELTTLEDPSDAIVKGYQAVRDNVGSPVCFRAPFMSIDDRVYSSLIELGVRHDSSVYGAPGALVYSVRGVMEHPVAKGKDRVGRTIAAYLWPMHEGRRTPMDYRDMAASMEDGDLLISTHTWHIVESRDDGPMSENRIRDNLNNVRVVLEGIMDEGFKPDIMVG